MRNTTALQQCSAVFIWRDAATANAAAPDWLELHPQAKTRYQEVATDRFQAQNRSMDTIRVEGVRAE